MAERLSIEARNATVSVLKTAGWATDEERDALTKTFRFRDFITAWRWMCGVAIWAEKLNHHPEWRNVYGTVEVVLTTHDAGGLTQLDLDLAQKMDALSRG